MNQLLKRIKHIRGDEGGSVLLLSGMMVFLVTIMAIFAMNTNKAIYNRIVAQNAADAAAETAALWQARGCNLMQHLNNFHYSVDKTLLVAETGAGIACHVAIIAAPAAAAAKASSWTGIGFIAMVALQATATISCSACATAPLIDKAQSICYDIVGPLKAMIKNVFPTLEFLYANEVAGQAGADNIINEVIPNYSGDIFLKMGIPILNKDSLLGRLGEGVKSVLNIKPANIYAFPLDPSALLLHATPKEGKEQPWKWNAKWIETPYKAAHTACTSKWSRPIVGSLFDYTGKQQPGKDTWGWTDEYYSGNPGFMTWIAGTKGQPELLGLGFLRWLNGGSPPSEALPMNSQDLPMYIGGVRNGNENTWLRIPAFMAFASSQVEGRPVVPHCDDSEVNAEAKLIPVYFPSISSVFSGKSPDENPTAGADFFIYH